MKHPRSHIHAHAHLHLPQADSPREFSVLVHIPAGVHQYKFIVDEEWRLNLDMPTVTENGVVNNTIEVLRPVFEDNRSFLVDSDEEELDEHKRKTVYGQTEPLAR